MNRVLPVTLSLLLASCSSYQRCDIPPEIYHQVSSQYRGPANGAIDDNKDGIIDATDLEFVKQETLGFCKNQVLKGAIVDAVDLLEQKK